MQQEMDPNTFTQKDLMQHLLHAPQHAVAREEVAAQFRNAEQQKNVLRKLTNHWEGSNKR